MKNKGFTLVELLATIAIIGILGIIAVGTIMNSVGGAKSDLSEYQKELLKSTAELYFDEEIYTIDENQYIVCIQQDLVSNNYLDDYKNSDGETIYGEITLDIYRNADGTIKKVTASEITEGVEENCSST